MASSALGSQSIALLQLPSGTLIDFAGTVEPLGWLMCDGRAVSRANFSSLFAAIGTTYGAGDGSTTFNIPDFRGRFARYMDNMGTAAGAAGRDTGRALGNAQGQATAKNGLTNASSSVSVSGTSGGGGGHGHTFTGAAISLRGNGSSVVSGTVAVGDSNLTPQGSFTPSGTLNSVADHTHSISATGTASAQTITGDAETRPINLSCNKIIKY